MTTNANAPRWPSFNALDESDWDLVSRLTRELSEIEGDRLENMDAVLTIMAGCPNHVFWYMDERPGEIGYEIDGKEWHYRLRTVRNDTSMGRRLLDALTPRSKLT